MKITQYAMLGLALLLGLNTQAQKINKATRPKVKNVLGFTPANAQKMNGVALGVSFTNRLLKSETGQKALVINGLNMGLNPFSLYASLFAEEFRPYERDIEYYDKVLVPASEGQINGVSVSVFHSNAIKIQGLAIAASVTSVDEINGVSVSGVSNLAYKLRGVSVAIVKNSVVQAHGIQIGLYNKAVDLRGFQFGLWNVNGRRSLPFINWQFGKKTRKIDNKPKPRRGK
ncbi:hypothetical protein BKI52_07845 [marine bacterium AO1-C]|nr:hypothetical protein BKI52_07845 [marine bacterium AO1-C]